MTCKAFINSIMLDAVDKRPQWLMDGHISGFSSTTVRRLLTSRRTSIKRSVVNDDRDFRRRLRMSTRLFRRVFWTMPCRSMVIIIRSGTVQECCCLPSPICDAKFLYSNNVHIGLFKSSLHDKCLFMGTQPIRWMRISS